MIKRSTRGVRRARKAQLPDDAFNQLFQLADECTLLTNQLTDFSAKIEAEWKNLQENYNDGTLPEDEANVIFNVGRYSRWLKDSAKSASSNVDGLQEELGKV